MSVNATTPRMLEVRGSSMVSDDYAGGSIALRLFQKDMNIIDDFTKGWVSPRPCSRPVPTSTTVP
jgi:3-hydroxyisobutyrate dehydrogenase-like beta-hydroxyacid dehydrogenase